MTKLQDWMSDNHESDPTLAEKITRAGSPISRVQINRIRRGLSGASRNTAIALEKVTGIPWPEFIGADDPAPRRKVHSPAPLHHGK